MDPLADLNAWHLDDFYGQLKMKGLSAKTIRNYHVTISGALTLAVRWEWVDRNVATRAQPPSIPQRGIDAPSPEDVLRLVEAAGERRPPLGTLILLGALTGMRRGELCGLRCRASTFWVVRLRSVAPWSWCPRVWPRSPPRPAGDAESPSTRRL